MARPYPVSAGLVWLADYLTSREGNPDMVNNINPQDCKPDEVYEGTLVGGDKMLTMQRLDSNNALGAPWKVFTGIPHAVSWYEDGWVEPLHRLVPARPITRDDLPDASVATDKYGAMRSMYFPAVDDYRDAVVAHLNANGGVPVSREDAALADRLERQATSIARLQGELETAERDRSSWRRAHGLVEQERITARAELAEAVARAEKLRDAIRSHPAMRGTVGMYGGTDDEFVDAMKARLDRLADDAEAAEARTAPAVTREQRDKVADHLWDEMVGSAKSVVRDAVARAFTAAGIETAIETTELDPVTEKARELWDVARPDGPYRWDDLLEEVSDKWLRLARHVLGQEADQ